VITRKVTAAVDLEDELPKRQGVPGNRQSFRWRN
jgi:hypothetical protein